MSHAQQSIIAQWQQEMQHTSGQIQHLLQQAGPGCHGLIVQNPIDPVPLNNAMTAVEQQFKELVRKGNDSLSTAYDRVTDAGPGEPAYSQMKRQLRAFDRWAEETWMRFDTHWHCEQYRAMWPHAQAAMQKQLPCNRCGAPLARKTPHKSESVTCTNCSAVNQVVPDTAVAQYFGGCSHYFAQSSVVDQWAALQKFKDDWEDHRDAEFAADRDRPDEPLERLKEREKMETAYWTAYAESRIKAEGGSPDEVRTLVEARMKQAFYDEMNLHPVWRASKGMQSVADQVTVPAHLRNVDEWGPLNPHQNQNALEDNWVHEQLLQEALREPDRHAGLLKALGYRDAVQRAMVHATFNKYYDMTGPQGQALITKAAMRAMNERMKYATQAASSGGILDPIEGVAISVYANLQAKQPGMKTEDFQKLLAQNQMDQAKWDRVAKGWLDRMQRDTTGVVATEYAKGFAGQGQYGAMGQASAANMASGQMGLQGPSVAGGGGEAMSFEKYCEVQGAMQAWTKQGKDISAMLHKHFQMTAMDVSNVGMYWMQKMMADLSMFEKQTNLTNQFEQKYLAMP